MTEHGVGGRLLRVPAVIGGTGTTISGRVLLASLLPAIRELLSMSSAAVGLSLTGFAIVVAFAHFPAGRLADALGHQLVLVSGLDGLAVGATLFATTIGSGQFVATLLVYGLGMGLYMPGAVIALSERCPDRRGVVLGLNSGSAQLGGIAASLLAVAVLSHTAWQDAFVPVLGLVVVLTAVLHLTRCGSYMASTVSLDARATVTRLFSNQSRRRAVLAAGLLMIAMEGATVFLPTFLHVAKSLPTAAANDTFALFLVVGLLVNPIAGRLADRYRPRLTAAVAVVVAVGGVLLLVVAGSQPVLVAGLVLLGVGIARFWPPFNAHLMAVLSDDDRGSQYGAARMCWIVIGSAGPAIVGTIGGAVDYATAFAALGVALCLTCVVLVDS